MSIILLNTSDISPQNIKFHQNKFIKMRDYSKRQLAAILFADIVGYTTLMQTNEELALSNLQKFKKELEIQIPKNQGEIIQFYGDGCLAIFNSSVNAVVAAKELQKAFQTEPKVAVRIGLHAGDIIFRDGNVFGDAVNIASRVESLGISGAVLLSSNIRNQIKNKPAFQLTSLGKYKFKNVQEGMTVYALANEGLPIPKRGEITGKLKEPIKKTISKLRLISLISLLGLMLVGFILVNKYWNKRVEDTAAIEKSIAVLPFRNDSPDDENKYFCNGIMEGILNHLAKIPQLTVVSRTSVEQYRENPPSLKKIGQELSVNYLVEGSVQKIGDRVIIFAKLSSTKNEGYLWSAKYDEQLTEIFSIQATVTESIAKELETIINPEIKERITAIPTKDPIAYDYYLQGNEFLFNANPLIQSNEEWRSLRNKATLFYELALERDSLLAEAYVGLAKVEYSKRYSSEIEENYLDTVFSLANKALSINPKLAYAYILRGKYYFFNNQFELTKKELNKAVELNPNDLSILFEQTTFLILNTDYLKAVDGLKKLEGIVRSEKEKKQLLQSYYILFGEIGDLKMQENYKRLLKEDWDDWWFYLKINELDSALITLNKLVPVETQSKLIFLGLIHMQKKEFDKAVEYFNQWEKLVKEEKIQVWEATRIGHRYGQALIRNGQKEKGMTIIQKQIKDFNQRLKLNRFDGILIYYDLANSHAFLGNKEKAYFWLEKFTAENGWKVGHLEYFIQYDIAFDNLRNEQRFQEIVNKGIQKKKRIRQQVKQYLDSFKLLD